MKLNKKGYIGAIGDDLPSLIPIFLGITIFFAVFLNTYNVYKKNTEIYSLKNDAINISGIMKEEPMFTDYNKFMETCNRINTKYNWSAFIINFDLNSMNYKKLTIDEIDEELVNHWENPEDEYKLYCGNIELEDLKMALKNKDMIIYRFPASVQQKFFIEPVWLYIIVWK